MKVLVTGREGQLARSLSRRAVETPDLQLDFIGRPEVDLAVPGALGAAIRDRRPDLLINAAAYTSVDRAEDEAALAYRVNAEAAKEAAVAAAATGARMIQISTDYVFDGALGRPYVEVDEPHALNVYGRTKQAGEEAVRRATADFLIVRTSWVISPFGANFVKTMLRLANERQEIPVVSDQRGSPTNALDLAGAVLRLAQAWNGASGTLHLAGVGDASWADLAEAVMEESARLGGPTALIRRITTPEYPTRAVRPADTRLDCAAAGERFGVRLPRWRESLVPLVAELLDAGRVAR